MRVCIAIAVLLASCSLRPRGSAENAAYAEAQHHGGQPFFQIRCAPNEQLACRNRARELCPNGYETLAMGIVGQGYDTRGGRVGRVMWAETRERKAYAIDVRCGVAAAATPVAASVSPPAPAAPPTSPAPVPAPAPTASAGAESNPFTVPASSGDAPMRDAPF